MFFNVEVNGDLFLKRNTGEKKAFNDSMKLVQHDPEAQKSYIDSKRYYLHPFIQLVCSH